MCFTFLFIGLPSHFAHPLLNLIQIAKLEVQFLIEKLPNVSKQVSLVALQLNTSQLKLAFQLFKLRLQRSNVNCFA